MGFEIFAACFLGFIAVLFCIAGYRSKIAMNFCDKCGGVGCPYCDPTKEIH